MVMLWSHSSPAVLQNRFVATHLYIYLIIEIALQGLAKGQNISKIGPVHVSWYSGQPSVTTKSTATLPAAKDVKVDKAAGDDLAPSSHEEHEQHHSPHAEEEVVANGWGGDGDEDGMGML